MSTEVTEANESLGITNDPNFPPQVVKRVIALRKLQFESDSVDEEYHAERVALEQKYFAKKQPFLEKRRDIINGVIEAEEEASETAPEGSPAVVAADAAPAADAGADVKGVPGFWFQALGNHPVTGDFMTENDAPALNHLEDIAVEYDADYTEFTLRFIFSENPFFTNKELVKKYTLTDILDDKSPQLTDIEGTEIEWKEGKNLCVKEIKKKQKAKSGKNKGQIRTITRQVPQPSFFHYFADPKCGEEEDEEEGKDEDEAPERISLNEEEDFEIGFVIRSSIVPDAILWYTGEAREDEDEDFDLEEGEDGEDGEEDDDEEDDEDEEPVARKGKDNKSNKKNKGGPAPAAGGEQPECKQN